MALELELQTYRTRLPELLQAEGKYALIQGEALLGIYDTYEDAIRVGYDKCGLQPFLVKKIEASEQIHFLTRHVTPCPM